MEDLKDLDTAARVTEFETSKREARQFAVLWLVQSTVMIGLFVSLGYYRDSDQLDFPLGLPSWYLFGVVVPSVVFLLITVWMALKMEEVDIS